METIKLGDSGFEVIKLQEILGIKADGVFGKMTHTAVVKFQKEHNLIADGIVGPITWRALIPKGDTELTNDDYEYFPMTPGITVNGKWLPNYYPGPVQKRWLILHHTAGWDNPYETVKFWERDNNTVATEYVLGGKHPNKGDLGYDGRMISCMPKGAYAWHASVGNTALHRESIGLEICSFGGLHKGGYYQGSKWIPKNPNGFYAWPGVEVSPDQVVDIGYVYRFNQYFHKISDKQIEEVKNLIYYLQDLYRINPKKGLYEMIKDKGVKYAFDFCNPTEMEKNPGIYTHGNAFAGKNDIFPQQELIDMIMSLT